MTSAISSLHACRTCWLAIDTSGTEGSLALATLNNENLLDLKQVEWRKKSAHSEVITLELQQLLQNAGKELKDLTHILVNIGPGSFTGLRIGVSLAKTLAYALGLEVLCVNSLELFAFNQNHTGEIFVAVKAIQNFYYAAHFNKTAEDIESVQAPHALTPESFPPAMKVWVPEAADATKAEHLLRFGLKYARKRRFLPWKNVEPLYVRGSEAEEKLKSGLLKPI